MTEKICPGSDPGLEGKQEEASPSKTKVTGSPGRRDLTVEAVILLLQERWPNCFSIHERGRRPLKVGIFTDVIAQLEGAVTHAELAKAIGCYVGNREYLKKIKTDATRVRRNAGRHGRGIRRTPRSISPRWFCKSHAVISEIGHRQERTRTAEGT